jgi:hypothetical protein
MTGNLSLGVPFSAANVIIPVEGPKGVMAVLDFNGTDGTYTVDGSQNIQQGKISYYQTLWVDNADNPNALTIQMEFTNQRVIIPANVQQYVNVLAPNMPVFHFSTTTGNFKVNVGFLNVPIQPDQWGGATAGFTGLTDAQLRATPVPVSGTLNNTNTGPAIVDRSVALNGADQVALTAGQGAHYIVIQNPPNWLMDVQMLFTLREQTLKPL